MLRPDLLVLDWNPSRIGDWLTTHGVRLGGIVVAIAIVYLILRHAVPPAIRRAMVRRDGSEEERREREKRAITLSIVLVRLGLWAMLIIGAFLALSEVGYNIVPVITGLGIGGVAIGLGAQSLVKDTINGIFILAENQFGYGDWVTLAGVSGVVEDVNLRRTIIRDVDGIVYTIPNSAIIVSGNHTRNYSGINVTVLIPQAANLDRALAVATETGKQLADDPEIGRNVLEAPRPARIETIDQNGATLRILGKAIAGTQTQLSFEYRRRLMDALSAAGLLASAPALAADASSPAGNGARQGDASQERSRR